MLHALNGGRGGDLVHHQPMAANALNRNALKYPTSDDLAAILLKKHDQDCANLYKAYTLAFIPYY